MWLVREIVAAEIQRGGLHGDGGGDFGGVFGSGGSGGSGNTRS